MQSTAFSVFVCGNGLWVYGFKGMNEAKQILRYENMNDEDQIIYKRHIENRRIEMGVTETAIDKGKRQRSID